MNFDYGDIFIRTFQITWKHKVFTGILFLPMLLSFGLFPVMFLFMFYFNESQTEEINVLITLLFLLFSFVILIGSMLAQVFASSAVTLGVVRVEKGDDSLGFMGLLLGSRQYFWRQLGAMIIVQLTIMTVLFIFLMFFSIVSMLTFGLAMIFFQPLFLLLSPLMALPIGVLESAQVAIIVEGLGAWQAVKRGVEMIREHFWKYLILILVAYFGTSLLSSFMAFPLIFTFMGIAIFSESVAEIGRIPFFGMTIVFFVISTLFITLASAISQTLMKVALDLTYLRLTHKDENQVIVGAE